LHVFDALVAALHEAERIDQLTAEEVGTAAIIGESRQ
jgi:hypothetical protein